MNFSFLHFNIRSINTNYNELQILLSIKNYDIISLQETFLSKNSPSIKINGYKAYEYRRHKQRGGGVAVLVREDIESHKISYKNITSTTPIEMVGARVLLRNNMNDGWDKIDFTSIYIPPDTSSDHVSTLCSLKLNSVFLAGDFNGHNPKWSQGIPNTIGKRMLRVIKQKRLTLIASNKGTMITKPNKKPSTPDFILYGCDLIPSPKKYTVLLPVGNSDHLPCLLEFENLDIRKNSTETKLKSDWSKTNISSLKEKLNTLNTLIKEKLQNYTDDVDTFYEYFICAVDLIILQTTPKKTIIAQKKGVPWFNKRIKALIKLKNNYWAKAFKLNSIFFFELFKKTRSETKKLIKLEKKKYFQDRNFRIDIFEYHKTNSRTKKQPIKEIYTDENKILKIPQDIDYLGKFLVNEPLNTSSLEECKEKPERLFKKSTPPFTEKIIEETIIILDSKKLVDLIIYQ